MVSSRLTCFNSVEFDGIRLEAGTNRFRLSVKQWTQKVGGIGIIAKTGRYGGTFAHKDIAFEFGSWLSPEFKLYLIKEFQRLKEQEAISGGLEWSIRRSLSKVQYRVHTDGVDFLVTSVDFGRLLLGYISRFMRPSGWPVALRQHLADTSAAAAHCEAL